MSESHDVIIIGSGAWGGTLDGKYMSKDTWPGVVAGGKSFELRILVTHDLVTQDPAVADALRVGDHLLSRMGQATG